MLLHWIRSHMTNSNVLWILVKMLSSVFGSASETIVSLLISLIFDCTSIKPLLVSTNRSLIDVSPSVRPFLHTQDMYFVFVQLLSSGSAWFAIIIIIITCLFPDVIKKVFYRHLHPTSTQKSQVSVTLQTLIQTEREMPILCVDTDEVVKHVAHVTA